MRRCAAVMLAIIAAIFGTVLTTAPAQADAFRSNYSIYISDGYCLDIPNSNAYVGQVVQQWWCNDTNAQKWNLTYDDSHHFQIEAAAFPGLCLNDWSGGDNTGDYIKLMYCSDIDSDFNVVGVDQSDYWQMQPRHAYKNCANMWGGTQLGNVMRLYPCTDAGANALFRLFP